MYNVFSHIKDNLQKNNSIPTTTLLNLNPSSQVCFDENDKQLGSCLRQVWLTKSDKEKTNPIGLNAVMASFSGNWWEDWFINQLKETGLYYNSGFPATDPARLVKGIVDVALRPSPDAPIELGELKTYDGSNYYVAQSILGNTKVSPKPRDKHLLQTFRYSLIYKDMIPKNNLFYLDRACGSWARHKQFQIELIEIEGKLHPKISTTWKDQYYEYVDTRISDVGIYRAEETLLDYFYKGEVPPKDFIEEFDDETIITKHLAKEIPDYIYNNYKKDPINNPIGDMACKYCPFSKGTCKLYE